MLFPDQGSGLNFGVAIGVYWTVILALISCGVAQAQAGEDDVHIDFMPSSRAAS